MFPSVSLWCCVMWSIFYVSLQTWCFGTLLFWRAIKAPPCHIDDSTQLFVKPTSYIPSSQFISVFLYLVCLCLSPPSLPCLSLVLRVSSCQWEMWSRQSFYERLWKVEVSVLTSLKRKKKIPYEQKMSSQSMYSVPLQRGKQFHPSATASWPIYGITWRPKLLKFWKVFWICRRIS